MRNVLLIAAAFAALTLPAFAKDLTAEQAEEADAFSLNNSLFVLYHESGHMMIGEFGLPVLGKEEDAADSFASVTLLQSKDEQAPQALSDAADGWYLSEASRDGDVYENADFYDEHSLDIQRSYQVVCLMTGANPQTYADVAKEYELDADRQESCGNDYQEAADSWTGLLKDHMGKGKPIKVVYEDAGDDLADIEQMLKDDKFLEKAASAMSDTYALPREITFRGKECGEENAFYTKEDADITFCYEMVGMFYDLIAQDLLNPPK